jgi:hypothetical protein
MTHRLFITTFFLAALLALPATAVELPESEAQRIIGVSPSAFLIPNLLQDSAQQRSFTVSHNFAAQGITQDVPIQLTIRGDYPEYLQLPGQVVSLAGESEFEVPFTIDAAQAAEGEYELFIDVMPDATAAAPASAPADGTSGASPAAAVVLGVTIPVNFTVVTEARAEVEIVDIVASETELDLPVFFTAAFQNTGNVDWRPDRIEITFTPSTGGGVEQSVTVPGETVPLTRAGDVGELTFRADPILSEGIYSARLRFMDGDAVRHERDNVVVVVHPRGVLNQEAIVGPVTFNKTTVTPGEIMRAGATVENTGDIVVEAILRAVVFSGQTEIAQHRSDPLAIDPKTQGRPELLFAIDQPGSYTVRSWVEYGNKKSDMTETTILVQASPAVIPAQDRLAIVLGAAVALLLLLAVVLVSRWRKVRRSIPPEKPPTQPDKPSDQPTIDTP